MMLKLFKSMIILLISFGIVQYCHFLIFYFSGLNRVSKVIKLTSNFSKVNYSHGINESMLSVRSKSLESHLERNNDLFGVNITNKIDYKLLLSPHNICKPICPYLIILVPSRPSSVKERKAIRETYGSLSIDKVSEINGTSIRHTVRVLFVLGTTTSKIQHDFVHREHSKFGDIVQYHFEESYFNLTTKILHGFKWISEHCNNSTYVLKVDEDTFVNTALLLVTLEKFSITPQGALYGCIYYHRRVLRYGKWKVPEISYPRSFYPNYLSGTAYTLTMNLLQRIVEMARHYRFPLINVEDAFITGIIATETLGAKLIALPGCSYWGEIHLKACEFVKSRRISKSMMQNTGIAKYKYEVWKALSTFQKSCK